MKTGVNVFLTGEPGAGKTHTVNQYVAYLRAHGIEPAITASTGIAATHIGGLTIHSWAGIGIKEKLSQHDINNIAGTERLAKRIAAAKVLLIDEVSMLPPYVLNLVDAVCRKIKDESTPFGGLQIILVGDFFQLPPIMRQQNIETQDSFFDVAPKTLEMSDRFAYGAAAWAAAEPVVCYLSEQYRQDDKDFLNILSAIRANGFGAAHLAQLQPRKIVYQNAPQNLPKLYTHNVDVDRVNDEMIRRLPGKGYGYDMVAHGRKVLVEVLQKGCLSPVHLILKINAAVMFTKNHQKGLYVNGTLGTVIGFDSVNKYPIVQTRSGERITAEPSDWILEDNGETLATITQLPLRLAWAITVHKSQGMSLDGAVMDLSSVFEFGQGYVALSRVRRLAGLFLLGWNQRAFEVHPDIVQVDRIFKTESEAQTAAFAAVAREELQKQHDEFIVNCGGRLAAQAFAHKTNFKKVKVSTQDQTLALWRAGKDLAEIVQARGLNRETIIAHLEKLKDQGKIKATELDKLIPDSLRPGLAEIQHAFEELGTDKLGPVFGLFDGRYSWEELKLARMMMGKK